MPAEGVTVGSVLIVDDHRIVAEALASRIRGQVPDARLEVAHTVAQARALARAMEPELVLLDHRLGEESGLDVVSALRPGTAIVVVSGDAPPEAIGRAFAAGVRAWVVKDGSSATLRAGVMAALAGEEFLSPSAVRSVVAGLGRAAPADPAGPSGFASACSERELDVLRCLVAGQERPQIAATLGISLNTVRTHLQHLFKAADVHSTLALLAAARECGVAPWDGTPGHSSHDRVDLG
ncbi:response regulator transcription factor [Alteromonas gracilis]